MPHGIYIKDLENSHCILDIGSMAAGEKDDVSHYFVLDPKSPTSFWEAKVRIRAVVKSEMRDSPFTGSYERYRSYFLDQMKVSPLKP